MLYVTYKKSKLENPIFIMFVIRTSSYQFISEHREREESCDRITDVQEGVKGGGGGVGILELWSYHISGERCPKNGEKNLEIISKYINKW